MNPNNPNQLDLSKFPKIVPPSAEEVKLETDRRSNGIRVIRELMENLLNAMQAYLVDLQDMDSRARLIEQQQFEMGEIDKQLRFGQHQLEAKEKGITEQLNYIAKRNAELIAQEMALKENTTTHQKETDETRREFEAKEKEIAEKMDKIKVSEEQLKELADRQSVVERSEAIDAERKALLDAREQKILQREARLARLENESKIG